MPIKRLHYFDHQFLVEKDFTDEQKYHLEMRRRLNRLLHTFGIAEGLEVVKQTNKIVTVKPGAAIDRLGREIILEASQDIDLGAITTAVPVFITIAYDEQQTDPSTATGAPGDTRFTEEPKLQAVTAPPPTDGSVIRLASIPLAAGGNVPGNVNDAFDGGVRQTAGPRGERGLASLNNVSNPGGNVDLISANAVTIIPDDANNKVTIGENHSVRTDNPHGTTAQQVQALPLAGGTLAGNLQVNGLLGIGAAPSTKLHVVGASPALRIADGSEAAGRVLVSDASGNAVWRDNSRFTKSGPLSGTTGTATTTFQKLADFMTFNKVANGSMIEIHMNTRAQGGTFSGSFGVIFQVRVDDAISLMANEGAITTSNVIEFISMYAVFESLAVGTHIVSVWIRTSIGTSSGVSLDPGNWGGCIIVREGF